MDYCRCSFKVILVGDGCVGKSSLAKSLEALFPTVQHGKGFMDLSYDLCQLTVSTSRGHILINLWDTAGRERWGRVSDGYYVQANAAILVFDVTNRLSHRHLKDWHANVERVCEDIPVVVCGNKADNAKGRKIMARHNKFPRKKGLSYYDTSAKSGDGLCTRLGDNDACCWIVN
ncbi:GTP binding nuclear protein Ran [Acanthamoeba castellanii medusavirus]|uniref:GTP binding nuclear protein Ran n=1 Tax=Acanthamoeba castellanii medusavirus J1 TaxID=3114988 RepID=A0A3T1CXE0_9VIRU|nr:GTP binding nuclear protein Ran [Acanthamoeba castellanii medusavirus]BBI30496.1 GTP binding nuclear protein Ran [Acanthamoeba castellanii medusavirus J1]